VLGWQQEQAGARGDSWAPGRQLGG
jgi:hypothetical protein